MNIELDAFSGAMDGRHAYNDGNTFLAGERSARAVSVLEM